ncbi:MULTISPECIES: hypothetical protein [unclassified Sphingomonas]|jgi:hypothetical protein|uniref:hypothetical protein n=1 Tax=unclassified Sphingomonas TaxID=196159 RepID=UPI0006F9802E|nr:MULTISPECIES: hypothetical protein [unclassified Sphingomonas]KQO09402.1 hypothetical protein ASF09_07200 [Sphingomonas sp. Leaf242]KQS51157.1 hypothetical protein ASG20_03595 [Sphingomonas sp. Leaf198]
MLRTVVLAALIALPGMAYAQDAQVDTPPQRIRSVTLTGDQKCPKSSGGEIVVCSTLDQPYRIPKSLRDDKPIAAKNQSWVNRAATMDQVGRVAGGLPDTCSAVGTGGQSGCFMQRNQAYAAERRASASESNTQP